MRGGKLNSCRGHGEVLFLRGDSQMMIRTKINGSLYSRAGVAG